MKSVLAVLLLSVVAVAQTNNFVAKFLNGTLTNSSIVAVNGNVGIGTKTPTQRFQVNFGDALVSGYQNFTAAGNLAHYYVGDTNHAVGAAWGAGMFFSTYAQPYAMVITDNVPANAIGTMVGIGTRSPQATLDVQANNNNYTCKGCMVFRAGLGALAVDGLSNVYLGNGTFVDNGGTTPYGVGSMVVNRIVFPDGTVQTTACQPTTVAATSVKRAVRKAKR